MKKNIASLALLISFSGIFLGSFPLTAAAGDTCTPACTGNTTCLEGSCASTVPIVVETPDTCPTACTGNTTCLNGTCTAVTIDPELLATPPAGGGNPNIQGGYVSLTSIPGLTNSTQTTPTDLPTFLNNLYKFCVGAAAILAVIQLIHAGILYSVGETMGKKQEAKHLIYAALGGLALVLSPFLVFSLINPSIVNLNQLNCDLSGLYVTPTGSVQPVLPPGCTPTTQ